MSIEYADGQRLPVSAPAISIPVSPFIDGRTLDPASDASLEVINPSTGLRCFSIPEGSDVDVDRAVISARRAFTEGRWADASLSFKKQALHRLADYIAAEASDFDALDAQEMGKPVRETFANASAAAALMRFYAEAVDKVTGDTYGSDCSSFVVQRRVPRGVIAAVVPWNFPTYVAVLKVAPALAAGNCIVLKPSELSSRSALRLAELALKAGVPSGVFNVVPGIGQTVGRALGLHMDVDMLTFTGSTGVGKLMLQYAGQSNMKAVITECGGKSPQIVFADGVDLNVAGDFIAQRLLINQGQICSVGSRLLVQRAAEDAVIEGITKRFKQAVVGDALDPATTFGPLVSAKQCTRVMQYISTASDEGAQLIVGGRRVLKEAGGYFVEPTAFRNVSPYSRIAQEEIFGPVLSVTAFDDEADALRIANNTIYGLSAYVWTTNLSTGLRMAKGVRSTVFINAAPSAGEGAGHAASSEPFKQSGIGTEGGLAGMESYLHRQLVWFNHS